ncbi:MAG: DUF3014 domain-containing protein [Porticoccaceae bacterium]|jgi:hypothetical protein|nr:DUF3014 domain-containing protein [Porticoccaceae bacterium]MEA3300023.1 DUF3014 domain-containing protein [Pseudomonadota bacterium]HLS99756.1 DUF3014 domain-containing protein [Porticoccaceae bacterium]
MKIDRDERLDNGTGSGGRLAGGKLPIIIGALVIIAAGAVWFATRPAEKPPAPVAIEEAPAPAQTPDDPLITQAPDIPQRAPEPAASEGETPAPIALPNLADSDGFARELLQPLTESEDLARWLGTDSLVQKAVGVIDGLARGVVVKKILPLEPPEDDFKVSVEQGVPWLDSTNYSRYDHYVNALTSIPPDALASSFHILRPLLEQAYGELGGNAETLDNRIIAAIDRMLLTPDHNGPFALERESVHYQFADPSLEALPGVQKQLLRMGPDNRARLKNYLKELRVALLAQATDGSAASTP